MADGNAQLKTIVNQDGAAILDATRGTISTLNSTGAYIWRALEVGEAVEDIVATLGRETGERPDTIRLDVDNFIAALREHNLLPQLKEGKRA
jgi:hypothetical protein